VLILDQDRRLWDRLLTGRGLEAMHRAERLAAAGSPVGPYMLQAGIAACHARARRGEDTDWKTILGLYDLLRTLWPNPVVELNRTVALAMVHGPQAALAELEQLCVRSAAVRLLLSAGGPGARARAGRPARRRPRYPAAGGQAHPQRTRAPAL
jgi:predicted RNA polymerase sigma factor